MTRKYALDANVLINFHRNFYPFDIAPAFWRQLIEKGNFKVILLDKIKNEIYSNEDQLSEWLKTNEVSFATKKSGDANILPNYTKILASIMDNQQYKESAKSEFASVADSWLCALALTYDHVIVTQETYEPHIKRRVKIPNVCNEFNITYINLQQFVREIGIRFD